MADRGYSDSFFSRGKPGHQQAGTWDSFLACQPECHQYRGVLVLGLLPRNTSPRVSSNVKASGPGILTPNGLRLDASEAARPNHGWEPGTDNIAWMVATDEA